MHILELDERGGRRQLIGHAVDTGDIQGFVDGLPQAHERVDVARAGEVAAQADVGRRDSTYTSQDNRINGLAGADTITGGVGFTIGSQERP